MFKNISILPPATRFLLHSFDLFPHVLGCRHRG